MNLYILVEDGKSGHKIIDHWIPLLVPKLSRARDVKSVTDNHYLVFSGLGYPRVLGTNPDSPSKNVLGQTIETLNANNKFDYFLIFLDGDDEGVIKRKNRVYEKIENYHEKLKCPYFIFVQDKCLETWLLGNRDFFPLEISKQFRTFVSHYNVYFEDPEVMENNPRYNTTTASIYHERYLRQMMKECGHFYNKSRPAPVMYTPEFISGLKTRLDQTDHLRSLLNFFDFMDSLNQALN